MTYISNLSDAMLVLAVGIMLALIIGWNVQGWNTVEPEENVDGDALEFSEGDLKELDDTALPGKDSEAMERLGEVFYDPDTGNYYIIQD